MRSGSSRPIRNPDLYVAGHRVEMVSAIDAVAAQLPDEALTRPELERNAFFSRFLTSPDRVGMWVDDVDPPGKRSVDVARRFITWARSLLDAARPYARRYVCVTHSGPMRALLRHHVLGHDPGEPEYVRACRADLRRTAALPLAVSRHGRTRRPPLTATPVGALLGGRLEPNWNQTAVVPVDSPTKKPRISRAFVDRGDRI